jgi:thiol-disulfide isomerase/thioredoxin
MTEANPESGRIWWILGILFVSGWCLYLRFFGPTTTRHSAAPALEGTALSKPADYDWMLSDLDGRPVPFDRYRGKTVFLNVWATWCPPCVAELPSIARLARSAKLERVAFVCVAVDAHPEPVRRFLEGKDWPMTFLHAPQTPPAFTTTDGAIPATFVIEPDGLIAASAVGSADWDDPSVVAFLERLAGPEAAPAAKSVRP